MRRLSFGLALPVALALAGCGNVDVPDHPDPLGHRSDETPYTGSSVEELLLIADDVKFEPTELVARAGTTTQLTLDNTDDVAHDFQIDEMDVDVVEANDPEEHGGNHEGADLSVHAPAGDSESVTFVANEPGSYEFYCAVSGHKEAGMVGTLIVE